MPVVCAMADFPINDISPVEFQRSKNSGPMFLRISKNSKRIIAVLSKNRTPSQIAWGIALGMVLGLVPKDNLLAIGLILAIAVLPVNQLMACIAACGLWMTSSWLEPITFYVGVLLLKQTIISSAITTLYRLPLLPWTCIDNALVCGGVATGILSLVPTYLLSRWTVSKAKQQVENMELEQVANDAINYRKAVVEQSSVRREKPSPVLRIAMEPEMDSMSPQDAIDSGASEPITKPELHSNRSGSRTKILIGKEQSSSKKTIDLPTKTVASPILAIDTVQPSSPPAPTFKPRTLPITTHDETNPIGSDTILRETVIEVVRYRRPAMSATTSSRTDDKPAATTLDQGNSMSVVNAPLSKPSDATRDNDFGVSKSLGESTSITIDPSHASASNRDESLRYLLWHINGTRDSSRKSTEKTA